MWWLRWTAEPDSRNKVSQTIRAKSLLSKQYQLTSWEWKGLSSVSYNKVPGQGHKGLHAGHVWLRYLPEQFNLGLLLGIQWDFKWSSALQTVMLCYLYWTSFCISWPGFPTVSLNTWKCGLTTWNETSGLLPCHLFYALSTSLPSPLTEQVKQRGLGKMQCQHYLSSHSTWGR